MNKLDKTVVKKIKLGQKSNDFSYWQTQPYHLRLAQLESIRTEYGIWKNDTQQGFQRVYRVIKQK